MTQEEIDALIEPLSTQELRDLIDTAERLWNQRRCHAVLDRRYFCRLDAHTPSIRPHEDYETFTDGDTVRKLVVTWRHDYEAPEYVAETPK